MTKIDIISGFLGAGKTTLIKKLIKEAFVGERVVLIENEFGEIGIDGGFMREAGIEITEMNSGCICCSLVGDFSKALGEVLQRYSPDRVIIEPSGVGKLSDVIKAAKSAETQNARLNSFTTVADAAKCRMYMKSFGEFFNNQLENAKCIVLSRTGGMTAEKIANAVELIRGVNESATIITTPWEELDGKAILDAIEHRDTMQSTIKELEHEHHEHHHHDHEHHDHDHHDHDAHCTCGCHDHEHEHEHEHDHHEHDHHDHGEHCTCGCHDHEHEHEHHDHDAHCTCGCHDHEHEHHHDHHHHHADEVFTSCGAETAKKYSVDELKEILNSLGDYSQYGIILRAKGIVDSNDGNGWIHFDYVPGELDIRRGAAGVIGRICVIGSGMEEKAVKELFKM